MAIDTALRRFVRQRAGNCCEYCGCHQDDLPLVTFHVHSPAMRPTITSASDFHSGRSPVCSWPSNDERRRRRILSPSTLGEDMLFLSPTGGNGQLPQESLMVALSREVEEVVQHVKS